MTAPQSTDAPGSRAWAGLMVLGLPTMLVSLDLSVLFLALPSMGTDLHASSTQQLWITDIYGFMVAGLLVTMGNVGDRIGRRKLLLIGAAAFGVASVLAAFSVSPAMLIGARALLGIAGSTLLPSILALIRGMFPDPRKMGTAIAVWTTFFMGGVALGPVVGGALLNHFWWGSVFLVGIPVMVLLLVTGPLLLPEHRAPAQGPIDPLSVLLSLAAALPVIYGLTEIARHGWRAVPIATVVIGLGFGVVFVRRQRHLPAPLLDLGLFRSRPLAGALLIGLLVGSVQSGSTMTVTTHLQSVEELSPLAAGLWMAVPALALIGATNAVPPLARRFRPAYLLAGGLVFSCVGYVLIVTIPDRGSLLELIIGVCLVYVGIGPVGALINQLVMGSAPQEKAGSAAGLSSTSGELGTALGVAALGSVAGAAYRGQLQLPRGVGADTAQSAQEGVAEALAAAGKVSDRLGVELAETARAAYTGALHSVAVTGAVVFLVLAVVAVAVLRSVPPIGTPPEPDAAEEPEAEEAGAPRG